jgi:adenosylhomocysteine nucleosidase
MPEVAIVAAVEREVGAAVRDWRVHIREHEGRNFKFFEKGDQAVLVCGGIGPQAARRACEAAIALYRPKTVVSLGFAGALNPSLHIGQPFAPNRVIDAQDGRVFELESGDAKLVTFATVASSDQKKKLALAYGAQAVDMEAASVARGAEARGVRFRAYKAISDPVHFQMPALERFIGANGQFHTVRFALFSLLRPWSWLSVLKLARHSWDASATLCQWLDQFNSPKGSVPKTLSTYCAAVQVKK